MLVAWRGAAVVLCHSVSAAVVANTAHTYPDFAPLSQHERTRRIPASSLPFPQEALSADWQPQAIVRKARLSAVATSAKTIRMDVLADGSIKPLSRLEDDGTIIDNPQALFANKLDVQYQLDEAEKGANALPQVVGVVAGLVASLLLLFSFWYFRPVNLEAVQSLRYSDYLLATPNRSPNSQFLEKHDFDFEVDLSEREENEGRVANDRSKLYKWCTPLDIERMGDLGLMFTRRSTLDDQVVEVEASEKSVEIFLLSRGVDLRSIGKKNMLAEMSLKIGVLEGCFVVPGVPQPTVSFVTETVRLRVEYNSLRLVTSHSENDEETASSGHELLPFGPKMRHESAMKAAMRLFESVLDVPADSVSFSEVSLGEVVMWKAKGFEAVRRNYIINVSLQDGRIDVHFKSGSMTKLDWSPIPRVENSTSDLIQSQRTRPLKEFLENNGVDTSKWTGDDRTQTLQDLKAEMATGGVSLEVDLEGKMKRRVNLVALSLCGVDGANYLIEVGRRDQSGDLRKVTRLPVARRKPNESVIDGATRLACEKLKIPVQDLKIVGIQSFAESTIDSGSWPGLKSTYGIFTVAAKLEISEANQRLGTSVGA